MLPLQRVIHAFAFVAIVCATMVACSIIGLSVIVSRFVPWEPQYSGEWLLLPIGIAGLVLLLAVIGICRLARWHLVAALALIPVSLFVFLGIDFTEPGSADLGARADDGDPLYRTVMWLAEGSPYSRLKEMPDYSTSTGVQLPKDGALWENYVKEHRAEITREWQDLNLGREWIKTLRTASIHGVWYQPVSAPFPSFKAVRKITNTTLAYAVLRDFDGDSESAIETLCDLLEAIQQIQRTGPTLVNQMICTIVVRQTLATASDILLRGGVSEPLRIRLKRTLESSPPMSLLIRNAFEGEVEFTKSVLDRAHAEENRSQSGNTKLDYFVDYGMRFFGPFVFNYKRTLALTTQTLRDVEKLGTARQLADLGKLQPRATNGIQQLKNPVGRLLSAMTIPAFEKVIQQMWLVEDSRKSLFQEVQTPSK